MKTIASLLGALFAGRNQHLSSAADLSRAIHQKTIADLDTKLRDALESLEDMKAEAHRHSEAAAAARLRNADLQRRLDATLQALDKARADFSLLQEKYTDVTTENATWKELEADRRIADLNNEKEGPKRDLEKFNDAQAARAMSRNTKQAFVVYQGAVKVILDRLDELGQKNHVTKEDLRKLRQLRSDLSDQIQRTI